MLWILFYDYFLGLGFIAFAYHLKVMVFPSALVKAWDGLCVDTRNVLRIN